MPPRGIGPSVGKDASPKKTFGSCFWNGSTENFEISFLWCLIQNRSINSSGLVTVVFSFREITRRPSDPNASPAKNNILLSPHTVSPTKKLTRLKQKHLSAKFSARSPKNVFSRFLASKKCLLEIVGIQKMFSRDFWYPKKCVFSRFLVDHFELRKLRRLFSLIKILI